MFLTNIYDDMKKKKNRYISEPKLNSLTKNSLNSVLNLLPALKKNFIFSAYTQTASIDNLTWKKPLKEVGSWPCFNLMIEVVLELRSLESKSR